MPRGVVRTPAFMPVGTAGTVKAMYPDQVKAAGADIVLGNTYHLMLRPGAERVASLGGLHRFMNWPYPILTDSGGFQVMSLAQLRKIDETGVTFQSHIDGSTHLLTPERAIEIQGLLGADIQMQLDECVKLPASDAAVEKAMRLSLRWAERCRIAFGEQPGRALFGIVQGGTVERLRVESARELVALDFKGYAIGGLAVGEPQGEMLAVIETVAPRLPDGKPRYLMGVGTPDDIVEAVAARHRHVRLRAADAGRAPRQRLHPLRPPQPEERKARRRPGADRCRVEVRAGEHLFEGLSAPPRALERDPRHDAADRHQPRLLPGADGGSAQGDRSTGASRTSSARRRKAGPRARATAATSTARFRPITRTERASLPAGEGRLG